MPLRDASLGIFEGVPIGPRLLSVLIDGICLSLLLVLSFVMLFGLDLSIEFESFGTGPLVHPGQMTWLDWVFTLFFPHGMILLSWIAFGATPGKLYIRSFIVDNSSGKKPKPWQLSIRYIVLVSPYLAVLLTGESAFFYAYLFYGFLCFNVRRRTLHDLLAGTVVVRMIGSDSTPIKFDKVGRRSTE